MLSLSLTSSLHLSAISFSASTCPFNLSASALCFSASSRHSDSHRDKLPPLSFDLHKRKETTLICPYCHPSDRPYKTCSGYTWLYNLNDNQGSLCCLLVASRSSDFPSSAPRFPVGPDWWQAMDWQDLAPLMMVLISCLGLSRRWVAVSPGFEHICLLQQNGHLMQNAMGVWGPPESPLHKIKQCLCACMH